MLRSPAILIASLWVLGVPMPAFAYSACFDTSVLTEPPISEWHREAEDFKSRTAPVNLIVLHATGGPSCDPRTSFKGGTRSGNEQHFLRTPSLSVHYVIGRGGKLVEMVDPDLVAYHAKGHNSRSVGIELVNDGDGKDPFSYEQLSTLFRLLEHLTSRFGLQLEQVRTHVELDQRYFTCSSPTAQGMVPAGEDAPGVLKKKQDPGAAFPWGAFVRVFQATAPSRVGSALDTSALPYHDCEVSGASPPPPGTPGAPALLPPSG
ncbi:MAG: N-acetylmuramoyl-L-alanine amidase [Myxococcota bacterium]